MGRAQTRASPRLPPSLLRRVTVRADGVRPRCDLVSPKPATGALKKFRFAAASRSPLTDSNRRLPPYHERQEGSIRPRLRVVCALSRLARSRVSSRFAWSCDSGATSRRCRADRRSVPAVGETTASQRRLPLKRLQVERACICARPAARGRATEPQWIARLRRALEQERGDQRADQQSHHSPNEGAPKPRHARSAIGTGTRRGSLVGGLTTLKQPSPTRSRTKPTWWFAGGRQSRIALFSRPWRATICRVSFNSAVTSARTAAP